jgi:hypothetical protein
LPDLKTISKGFEMNASLRNQLFSIAAALVCAFITIGMSIAPAVNNGIA